MTVPEEEYSHLWHVVHSAYPNGVTYQLHQSDFDLHYIIRCNVCAQIGISTNFSFSGHSYVLQEPAFLSGVRTELNDHALKHNDLVRRIQDNFTLVPKDQGIACPNAIGHPGTKDQPGVAPPPHPAEMALGAAFLEQLGKGLKNGAEAREKEKEKPKHFRHIELTDSLDK